jgi:hypothetical protein
MKKPVVRKLRCAVYTRKSTEEGSRPLSCAA